jgi:hypothetical protein
MAPLRRRLASGALALTVLQLALLFAAPLSACCPSNRAAHQAKVAAETECCPAGSHAPGECPLHRGSRAGDRQSARTTQTEGACRMICDAPHGAPLLLGATGIVPSPQAVEIDLTAYAMAVGASSITTDRPSFPDAPPPRLL